MEVKQELSYAEQQRLVGAGITKMRVEDLRDEAGDAEVGIDMEAYEVKRLAIWIVDWSFCGEDDKRVEVSSAAIAALTPDTAEEINDLITKHILAVEKSKKVKPVKRSAATKSVS